MDKKFLTTSEVSKLLNINEKKVYVLAQEGVIPATKITGKWLFPEEELINYLKYNSLKNLKNGIPFSLLENEILIGAGSDDPILTKIFSSFYQKNKFHIFYTTVGSKNGIDLLKKRVVHFALSHLYDKEKNDFNIPYLKKVFPVDDYVVINLFYREIGLISSESIKDISELKGFTFVLRQLGSGIREITEQFFESGILNKKNFSFYSEVASTHVEVALLVKQNKKFIGIATYSVANIFDLKFYKLFDERFDLITLKDYFFNKTFQTFYNFMMENKLNFSELKGYNFNQSSKIIV